MKKLFIGLLVLGTFSSAFSMSLEKDKNFDFSNVQEDTLPSTFLETKTLYINHGGISEAYVQYFPGTSELVVTYNHILNPMREEVYGYSQVYSCQKFNQPCRVVRDELGFAKSLTVFSDGSILYKNIYSVTTVMVNAEKINKAHRNAVEPF